LFIVGFFYLICFFPVFQIKKVIVTGEKKVLAQDIKKTVKKEIEKNILFFSTKSIFLTRPDKIREVILNNFPQIEDVEVHRGFPDGLDIVVIERIGKAFWCQEKQCFLVDDQGIIFEKVEAGSLPFLKIVSLKKVKDIKLGQQVIEKNLLSQILEIESKIKKDSKIDLDEMLIASNIRLIAKTSEGWQIYFNLEKDIDWQITELNLVLQQEIPENKRRNLEYIDLRFSKVYYKYKD